jgi:leucyl-tRNA synthetase
MDESVDRFSADACRLGLADAGDKHDDSNFDTDVANACILQLSRIEEFICKFHKKISPLRNSQKSFFDEAMINEIKYMVLNTDKMYACQKFREAKQLAWDNMSSLLKLYQQLLKDQDQALHEEVTAFMLHCMVICLAPICPHWCEHIWQNYDSIRLDCGSKFVVSAQWPLCKEDDVDSLLRKKFNFVTDILNSVNQTKSNKKFKNKKLTKLVILIREDFKDFQKEILLKMKQSIVEGTLPSDIMRTISSLDIVKKASKRDKKGMLAFAGFAKKEYNSGKTNALDCKIPFNQIETIENNITCIEKCSGCKVQVRSTNDVSPDDKILSNLCQKVQPLSAGFHLECQ